MRHASTITISVVAACLTIGLDQATKWLAAQRGIIVLNPGGAFSIASGLPAIVGWLGIAVVIILMLWWPRATDSDKVLIAFILGAGLSNIADRFSLGGVRDFINLPWFTVFNVADFIMSVSVGWLVLFTLFRPPRR